MRNNRDILTSQEVHIIHPFAHDFYGHDMSVLVLGFIRPELDYVSKGQSRTIVMLNDPLHPLKADGERRDGR